MLSAAMNAQSGASLHRPPTKGSGPEGD
jgi:hypothetical protein